MSPSETAAAWPEAVALHGTDHLMLAFDDWMRRHLGHGLVCRLIIELESQLDPDLLGRTLLASPAWCWLSRLRLTRGWGPRVWRVDVDAAVVLPRLQRAESEQAVLEAAMGTPSIGDPHTQAPLALDLYHLSSRRSALVLSWHHVALDARGAESLIRALADGSLATLDPALVVGQPLVPATSIWRALWTAKQARDAVLWSSLPPPSTLSRVGHAPTVPRWEVMSFSADETAAADRVAAANGAMLLKNAWHVVATARAARDQLGPSARTLLIPVPQDRRKRGARGPILGNRIGTLFYKVRSAELDSLPAAVSTVSEGLRTWMRSGLPEAYLTLLDLCRYLPSRVLRRLVGLPSLGRLATVGASDLGESLAGVNEILGHRVRDAIHLPANLSPPGWTVVFSRRAGHLRVVVVGLDGADTNGKLARFSQGLRALLLGETGR